MTKKKEPSEELVRIFRYLDKIELQYDVDFDDYYAEKFNWIHNLEFGKVQQRQYHEWREKLIENRDKGLEEYPEGCDIGHPCDDPQETNL